MICILHHHSLYIVSSLSSFIYGTTHKGGKMKLIRETEKTEVWQCENCEEIREIPKGSDESCSQCEVAK